MSKKNTPIVLAVLFLIFLGAFLIKSQKQIPAISSEKILFSSDSCPHCQIVDKFISDNKIREKIKLTEKKIDNNPENTKEIINYAKQCGNQSGSVNIPLLWNGTTCLVGDQEIINYFQEAIK